MHAHALPLALALVVAVFNAPVPGTLLAWCLTGGDGTAAPYEGSLGAVIGFDGFLTVAAVRVQWTTGPRALAVLGYVAAGAAAVLAVPVLAKEEGWTALPYMLGEAGLFAVPALLLVPAGQAIL